MKKYLSSGRKKLEDKKVFDFDDLFNGDYQPKSFSSSWMGGLLLYLNFTLTCKAVCCAIFNKLHHHIFLSYELTQGGAPCDEAAH